MFPIFDFLRIKAFGRSKRLFLVFFSYLRVSTLFLFVQTEPQVLLVYLLSNFEENKLGCFRITSRTHAHHSADFC